MASALEFDSECLVLGAVREGRREAFATDGLLYELASNELLLPKAGDVVRHESGREVPWRTATFQDGKLELPPADEGEEESPRRRGPRVQYIYLSVTSDHEQLQILEARGHSAVLVNGEWRIGDAYGNNPVPIPVVLKEGTNHFLFAAGRRAGNFTASLGDPEQPVYFLDQDATIPEWQEGGDRGDQWAAAIVVNAMDTWMDGLEIRSGGDLTTPCGPIPPLGFRKLSFRARPGQEIDGVLPVRCALYQTESDHLIVEKEFLSTLTPADGTRRVTFVSEIDGSVQYYGLTPAVEDADGGGAGAPGLLLSLHGAGVGARGQAACYKNKDWLHVVAPTNRRRFGFDWEDWGRLDALEALAHARDSLQPNPWRQYLSGHSMGGHGTWQLGVHFPDQFAAIGPSAGWISFSSYAGALEREEPSEIENVFLRAASPSDTLALSTNYLQQGVYILHGDQDNNVPVSHARTMREHLATYHPNFAYYERAGAGHWWGNQCLDWPPMFDFFKHHELPRWGEIKKVNFKTSSPAVSASCHWARIEAQIVPLTTSAVDLAYDPAERHFSGTTENVARLSFDIGHIPPGDPLTVELDGQMLANVMSPAGTQRIWMTHGENGWEIAGPPSALVKRPERMGPFKEAFRNRMVFVYGTNGNAEENRWAFAKARFDAETFWYRGNGSIDIVSDSDFEPSAYADRSVILYGNRASNAAWDSVLTGCPIEVGDGAVQFGEETIEGDDLTCLFVYPRADSDIASVGVVSGTGTAGLRAADRLPYFVSGIGYPDYTIMKAETLQKGSEGVARAGFFDNEWKLMR